jgi:chaperone modulatory protein CbpM
MNSPTGGDASRQLRLVQQVYLTLYELSAAHAVTSERICELVDEGALDPLGNGRADWRFDEHQWQQAGICIRLQRDLGVNLPGVALALQLLEEISRLQHA